MTNATKSKTAQVSKAERRRAAPASEGSAPADADRWRGAGCRPGRRGRRAERRRKRWRRHEPGAGRQGHDRPRARTAAPDRGQGPRVHGSDARRGHDDVGRLPGHADGAVDLGAVVPALPGRAPAALRRRGRASGRADGSSVVLRDRPAARTDARGVPGLRGPDVPRGRSTTPTARSCRAWGSQSYPTTYYVDPSGTVVNVTVGEVPDDRLTQILDELPPRVAAEASGSANGRAAARPFRVGEGARSSREERRTWVNGRWRRRGAREAELRRRH